MICLGSSHLYYIAWIKDLYPIAVWVLDKGETLHAAIVGSLDKLNVLFFEARAGHVNVRHHNTDVSETTGIRVSGVIFLVRIGFAAPVTKK